MRLGEGLGCWDQANLRSVLMRAGWDRGRGVWGRVCTPSLGFKTRFGLQAALGVRDDAQGRAGPGRLPPWGDWFGGHRWAASVGSVSLRDMQSDSKTDERGRSAPAVHVLTLNRVVRGRSRCRASSGHTCRAVGFRGSIGWVVGAARSRWGPICQLCLAACAGVWCGAQRRERVQNESGSGRAWARKAGEATVRPGAR